MGNSGSFSIFQRPINLLRHVGSISWKPYIPILWILLFLAAALYAATNQSAFAGLVNLPGDDASDKLEAAGILLRLIDTAMFKWGARIFAGVLLVSAGWSLKELRFATCAICTIGAVMIGLAPKFVKNIFDVSDNQSLFSQLEISPYSSPRLPLACSSALPEHEYA